MKSSDHAKMITRVVSSSLLAVSLYAWAQAPDATGDGPLDTTSAEYRFAPAVDPAVISDRATEIWARLYRPATLAPGAQYPLIVFLHGNHATCGFGSNPRHDTNCQYTTSGTCPTGFVVVPNHQGYEYLANKLAS